jgi:FkbM family methyltransferase
VIDVGVASGTPELYDAFPDAYYLLVEPMAETEERMRQILEQVRGEYVIAAATTEPGNINLLISPDPVEHWGSTIYASRDDQTKNWVERSVPAVRLDDVVAERRLEGPFLIKADTEGSELEVLGGADRVLEDTLAVALEVSLVDKLDGAPRMADVVGFMAERGFVPYDIVAGYNRESDGALVLVDMVFLREG